MAKSWHPLDVHKSAAQDTSETQTPVTSPNPVYRAGAETVNGFDIRALYPEAQQPAAEQRNQGEAGSGFDIQQLYSDKEQPSSPASPSILKGEQVDALLPAGQRNTLEQFASSKGLQVQYINDPDSPVSGSIQGNTMTINLGNGSYALGTAIHEVGHAMKAGDGKAFAEFQAAVLRLADTDPGLRRVAAGIVDAYLGDTSPARASMLNEDGSINRAALNEEVALKLAEELVQDPEQLIRTVSQDRTLIARFLDFVRKIKNSVSIRFTGSQKAMLDEAERTLENMLRGQAGEVGENRYSYIGENANLTDAQRAALETARQLETQGEDAERIRQQTGWHRGVDGRWRTELDDSGAMFYEDGDAAFREENPDYDRYMTLVSKMLDNTLSDAERVELSALDETWGDQPARLSERVQRGEATLADVLRHPELFNAYPQLRDVGVRFENLPDAHAGRYYPSSNEIAMSNLPIEPYEQTILHEAQHRIQDIEGFAQGSNLSTGEQHALLEAYEKVKNTDVFKKLGTYDDRLAFIKKEAKRNANGAIGDQQYRRAAGEVEARDTAARWRLDRSERVQTAPDMTGSTLYAEDPAGACLDMLRKIGYPVGNTKGNGGAIGGDEGRSRGIQSILPQTESRKGRNLSGSDEGPALEKRPALGTVQRAERPAGGGNGSGLYRLNDALSDSGIDAYTVDDVRTIEDELSRITAEQRALREERNAWMDSAEVQELEERRKAAIKEYGVLRLQQWKNATPEWQAYTAKRQEYNARAKALQDRADELTEALRGSRQVQEQADWEERQAQQAAYDRAVAESGLSVADYHRQSAASRFGTTDQFEAAGYILPDGQMLDFSGPEKTRRSQDHREIESVFGPAELGRNADSTTALNQFIAEGNVRVMAESPGVDISGEVRPSAAQLDAIRRMADTLGAARQGFNLDISDNTGKVVASKWYTGHVRGERVINDIRAFYETGSLPQDSGLSGFHSLRTKGGVNLNGARTLDEYIAQKYGSQPAAPTATEAEAPTSNAAPDAETPVSDASPAAEPAASSDTEDAGPALERTVKSERIQKQKESRFVRELGELFGIPEGERRDNLRQLTTQLADQRRTTGRVD